jgi:hypothetical protein
MQSAQRLYVVEWELDARVAFGLRGRRVGPMINVPDDLRRKANPSWLKRRDYVVDEER